MVVRVRVTGLVVFPYSDLMTPTFLISVYHSFYYDDKSCGDQRARTDLMFYPVKFSRQTHPHGALDSTGDQQQESTEV